MIGTCHVAGCEMNAKVRYVESGLRLCRFHLWQLDRALETDRLARTFLSRLPESIRNKELDSVEKEG